MNAVYVIAVTALVTVLTRFLPFAVFGKRPLPRVVVYLGRVLPPAIMAALVVYCLKDIDLTAFPFGLAQLISVAVTALVHLWRRNTLLSIALGTACYMVLIRTVFLIL
ncbi:MAG TPA: AzlD domain-containing protein [Candidatus Pullichristensenella stercorigallinarum]|uniref:AzlD domain-containing protein n=1 Tax=Candidatus Pullichristensenella stercorigallinarum TaxID=2840909 RepID=A0A9D0ZL62_9FIRM|nr:AzlD domain-containing protein [Candidatus Pullichristensenella stercorigallinarum]